MKMSLAFLFVLFAQLGNSQTSLNWLGAKELQEQYSNAPKPIILFVYTDWCKICKMQEAQMQSDSALSFALENSFYLFRINAESRIALNFFGRIYEFDDASGYHELALYFAARQNQLEFPSTVILDSNLNPVFFRQGLMSRKDWQQFIAVE